MNLPATLMRFQSGFEIMETALEVAQEKMGTLQSNTAQVGGYDTGAGSLSKLEDILRPRRDLNPTGIVFLIDHYFRNSTLQDQLPIQSADLVIYVDTSHEPSTRSVDQLKALTVSHYSDNLPTAIVGIGGGSTLDTAKAVSNLLTNPGPSANYQGWDLVKNPGVYKVGIPTLAGTGAEASRTCVLTNYETGVKLGMNSNYTLFDQLILDPNLLKTIPRKQFFYTGMDTYIHCIESLKGSLRHAAADELSRQALELVREVFLSDEMQSVENCEKLMAAAFLGGTAIANSMVGVVHPFSAGLSIVRGTHHCEANCIALQALSEFYPEATQEFEEMRSKQEITIPMGLCKGATDKEHKQLRASTVVHEKPLRNALGEDFARLLTEERVRSIFERM
jgi:3-deoxy-alpha-D-manno-octulosonate 8-oxidase